VLRVTKERKSVSRKAEKSHVAKKKKEKKKKSAF